MPTPIRIGIVGAGRNTRDRHIPGLKAVPGVELVSVCNRSRASSQRAADDFGIPIVYDTWQELVAAPDTDAIMIGTWPYMHSEMSRAVLAAGKHVLCEARMAMNASEARAMLAVSRAHPNLIAQIVPSPFTFWADETIKDLLAAGYIGELYSLQIRGGNPTFADPNAPLHWRQRQELSGYNIMNMGIWYEAAMRWVGPVQNVFARGRIFTAQRRNTETDAMGTVDVPDHLDVIADLPNGAQVTYNFSAICGLAPSPGAWLFGSEGTLHVDQERRKLFGGKRGDTTLQEIPIAKEKEGFWRVEAEFIGAIRGEEEIRLTSFADGVKYMEFTEAVHRSLASGEMVALPRA